MSKKIFNLPMNVNKWGANYGDDGDGGFELSLPICEIGVAGRKNRIVAMVKHDGEMKPAQSVPDFQGFYYGLN